MQRHTCWVATYLAMIICLAACAAPPAQPPVAGLASTAAPSATMATVAPSQPTIIITDGALSRPFSPRLLGTNLPAWLGPERLASPQLRDQATALGPSPIRLPGGSWSNAYDWLACESSDESACHWPWAARPSDFLQFLRATSQEAIWTVSINGTAKEAAALVAFFNGDVADETPIGIDVRGRDWHTTGYWARLRAANGSPEPLPIRLWEVGNEVYGGKPEAGGSGCASWGWEDVWTCDGTEYVRGRGAGSERREGYLEFRAAMRAVDPDILVGAVGVAGPAEWGNWGNEVIAAAGAELDLYIIHLYAFSETPAAADILARPQQIWPDAIRELDAAFVQHAGGRRAPVAVTEYNLVAFQELDEGALMRRAVNALFIADSIGQMALGGVVLANQWNLANGVAANGTDYGMVDAESFVPNPQFYGLSLWQGFGEELIPVQAPFDAQRELSLYAGRGTGGNYTLLAINKTARPITASVQIDPAPGRLAGSRSELRADALESDQIWLNGETARADGAASPPAPIEPFSGPLAETFAPYSITVLHLKPAL